MDAPETLTELQEHLTRALDKISERTDLYIAAKEYYDGEHAEVFDSRAAESVVSQSKRTPVSFAHIPVDVLAEKVDLSGIATEDKNAQRALTEWMDANDIDDEATEWIRRACMFGDYYVVTDPTSFDTDDRAIADEITEVGMSPLSTVVIYDKKTGRTKLFGAHFWDAGTKDAPVTRAFLYYDDYSVKLIADGKTVTDAESFRLDFDALVGEELEDAYIENEADGMLISHLPIGSKPYGTPVHKKAWGFQDAITKISANNLVNVDAQGLPSRWALMDPNAEVDDDIDEDFGTDGPTTAAGSGDGRTTATTGRRTRTIPGAVEYLRGVKQTGTYDAAQTDPFLSGMDWYLRGMAVATGIAIFEFDMKGEQPSGESRRRAEGRANRTAKRIKRNAGAFLRELADNMLSLTGHPAEVTVTFTPSETATDKDGLELVGLKVKNGVPLRQALLEAGYTDEQVASWYPENAPAFSMDTVTLIADALQSLGGAKALGAITSAGIEAMIPELFDYAQLVEEGGIDTLPLVDAEISDGMVTNAGTEFKAKADALGILIRAGADPEEAADAVETGNLSGLTFPNVPVTIRLPESAASGLEGDAPAPTAP